MSSFHECPACHGYLPRKVTRCGPCHNPVRWAEEDGWRRGYNAHGKLVARERIADGPQRALPAQPSIAFLGVPISNIGGENVA